MQRANLVTSGNCVRDLKDWVCIAHMYYQGLQSSLKSAICISFVHFQHKKNVANKKQTNTNWTN